MARKKGIEVNLLLADKNLKRQLKGAQKSFTQFAGKIGNALKKGALVGGTAMAGMTAGFVKLGVEFDAFNSSIARATGATGLELSGLQYSAAKVLGQVSNDMDEVATVFGTAATLFKGTTGEIEDATVKTLDLARVTGTSGEGLAMSLGRIANLWQVSASDIDFDLLYKVTADTGISLEKLFGAMEGYGGTLRGMGFDMDEVVIALGQMYKEGINIERVMPGFARVLADASKKSWGARGVLLGLTSTMGRMTTEAEKTAFAVEKVGVEAAPQFVAAVNAGLRYNKHFFTEYKSSATGSLGAVVESSTTAKEKMQRLFNKLREQFYYHLQPVFRDLVEFAEGHLPAVIALMERIKWGDIVGSGRDMSESALAWIQDTIGTVDWPGLATTLSDLVEPLKALGTATLALAEAGLIALLLALAPAIEALTPIVATIVETITPWIRSLAELAAQHPEITALTLVLLKFAPALIKLGAAFVKVYGILKLVPVALVATKLSLLALGAALGPVGLTIVGLAALAGGFYLAYQRSEEFRVLVDKIHVWLRDVFAPEAAAVFKTIGEVLRTIGEIIIPGLITQFNGIKDVVLGIGLLVKSVFVGDWQDAYEAIKMITKGALTYMRGLYDVTFGSVIRGFKAMFEHWDLLTRGFKGAWQGTMTAMTWTWDGFTKDMSRLWGSYNKLFDRVWSVTVRYLGERFDTFVGGPIKSGLSSIDNMFRALGRALERLWSATFRRIEAIFDATVGRVSGQVDWVMAQINRVAAAARTAASLASKVSAPVSIAKKLPIIGGFFGAAGGVVTRPTLATIGESGPEAVVPLSRAPGASPLPGGMGGGITVNVNVEGNLLSDDQAVARTVVEALRYYERTSGPLPLRIA